MKRIELGPQAQRPGARYGSRGAAHEAQRSLHWLFAAVPRSWNWLIWLIGPLVALIATSQWFTPGYLLGGGDNFPGIYPNPGNWLARMPYSWDLTGIGGPTSLVQTAPQIITVGLLRLVLDPAGAQHAFYALLLAAEISSMMLLIVTVLPGHRLAAVLGGLFYAFNPATVIVPPGFFGIFEGAYLPCIAALFIRAATGPLRLRRLALLAAGAACSGTLFTNPPTFAILLIFSLLIVVYVIARNWTTKGMILLRITLLFGIVLLANVYWLADGYDVLLGYVQQGVGGLASSVYNWGLVSQRSSILNMFWLNSSWAWDAYFPYSVAYRSSLLLAVVYLPTLLAFSALLNRTLPRLVVLPSAAIALIMLLFCTGQHQPWVAINLFFYRHVPLFWLFREPNAKFISILLVVYALLVGYQAEWLAVQVAGLVRRSGIGAVIAQSGVAAAFAGIFLLTGFPLVTGASAGREHAGDKTGFVIPQYWYQLGRYLAHAGLADGVLLLPNDDYYQMRYTWGYYGADALASEMISNHVIPVGGELGYVSSAHSGSITGEVVRMVQEGNRRPLVPYLAALGTRYIVQRNDIDAIEPGRRVATRRQVRRFLRGQSGLHFVRSFGHLDLYEVDRRYYVPPVYAVSVPQRDVVGAGPRLEQRMTRDLAKALGFSTTGLSTPRTLSLDVTRETPLRYAIRVGQGSGPVLVVVSTSYHPSWHACLVPEGEAVAPWTCWLNGFLPPRDHVAALGFLNGWVIDHPGRYVVVVDYGFQHIADLGILVSILTLGGLALVALVRWGVRRRRRTPAATPGAVVRSLCPPRAGRRPPEDACANAYGNVGNDGHER